MSPRSHLTVVRQDALPPPLLPTGIDLTDFPEYMINIDWVTNPRFWIGIPREAKCAAMEIQIASMIEDIPGSLPSDEESLALAAGLLGNLEAWRKVASVALRGWTLCSDDRYYRADVSKKVLHNWIVRLADRKRGAAGQARRRKEEFDARQFDADIAVAVACMTRLDPYAPILRNYRNANPEVDGSPAIAPSNAPDNSKLSEAKLSEDSSSPLRGEDSSEPALPLDLEAEAGGGSVNRTTESGGPPSRASPWPPDASAVLRVHYPRKDGWGRAEKTLERIRKAGKVPFEEVLAGADRVAALVESGRQELRYTPMAATWLNDRGWENPDPPEGGKPPAGPPGSPRFRNPYFRKVAEAVQRERSP